MATELDDATVEALEKHGQELGIVPEAGPVVSGEEGAEAAPEASTEGEPQEPKEGEPQEPQESPGGDGLPELDEEQLRALYERYKEGFSKLDEVQERVSEEAQKLVEQQVLEQVSDPATSPEFVALMQDYEVHGKELADTLEQLAPMVQRLDQGDVDVDPKALGQHVQKAVLAAARQRDIALAAGDHRGVLAVDGAVNALFAAEADTPVGKGPGGKPVTLDEAWAGVLAGYETLRRAQDPRARAGAASWFVRTALPLIYNLGVQKGVEHGRQQAAKQQRAAVKAAEDAALREALAKVGASHPATPAGQTAAPEVLTADRVRSMSDAEYEAHQGEVHKLIGSLLGV